MVPAQRLGRGEPRVTQPDPGQLAPHSAALPGAQDRIPALPVFSSRILSHPSLQSLYTAVGAGRGGWRAGDFPVPVMIPSDFFYTSPSLPVGSRVANAVTQFEVFECCRLNTPAPIMSSVVAPPIIPDPFRIQTHCQRDLGSQVQHRGDRRNGMQQLEVIQLSMEEDQVVTSLLALQYCPLDEIYEMSSFMEHMVPDSRGN